MQHYTSSCNVIAVARDTGTAVVPVLNDLLQLSGLAKARAARCALQSKSSAMQREWLLTREFRRHGARSTRSSGRRRMVSETRVLLHRGPNSNKIGRRLLNQRGWGSHEHYRYHRRAIGFHFVDEVGWQPACGRNGNWTCDRGVCRVLGPLIVQKEKALEALLHRARLHRHGTRNFSAVFRTRSAPTTA